MHLIYRALEAATTVQLWFAVAMTVELLQILPAFYSESVLFAVDSSPEIAIKLRQL